MGIYVVGNSVYNLSGYYIDTFINTNGCISLVHTYLTVSDTMNIDIYQSGNVLSTNIVGEFHHIRIYGIS